MYCEALPLLDCLKMTSNKRIVTSKSHADFVSEISQSIGGRSSTKYKKYIFNKRIGVKITPGLNLPVTRKESFLKPYLKIQPEILSFLFSVGGCPKNLLLYILVQEHDQKTGYYSFNASIIDDFRDFCLRFFATSYSVNTVKQAHRALVGKKITLNVKVGTYFLNPLISGGSNDTERRELINTYTSLLKIKGKDPATGIYPVYK